MSVYYEIKEHLLVADTERHQQIKNLAVSQLCLMGAWILGGRSGFASLTAIADGEAYHFSGNTMTEDYHKLVQALRNARSLEIISSYYYSYSVLEMDPGPFPMVELLGEFVKGDPEELRGMFYSMYNNADCGEGAGGIAVFGEKGGQLYTGQVAFEDVDSIPEGDWYTPASAVYCELYDPEGRDLDAIEAVCRRMCEFSSGDTLIRTEDGDFSFFLNNLRIRTDAQLKTFLDLFVQLIDLTDGECGLVGELADISGPDVRILHFDVDADGGCSFKVAAIAE